LTKQRSEGRFLVKGGDIEEHGGVPARATVRKMQPAPSRSLFNFGMKKKDGLDI
jgi:hypothetical protein